jgi:hypothetical protein
MNNGNRDILGDYPELYDKLKKEELGYVKGIISHRFILRNILNSDTNGL